MDSNKSKENQKQISNKLLETRKHLETVVYNLSDYKIRNDPVIRALLKGLQRDDPYGANNVTVATLRAAGCLDKELAAEVKPSAPSMKVKNKKEVKLVKDQKQVKDQKPKPPRGRDRIFDFFISLDMMPEKVMDRILDLRRDGDKTIKFAKTTLGVVATVERKIKEINDFDLLYLLDETMYDIAFDMMSDENVRSAVRTALDHFRKATAPLGLLKSLKGPVLSLLETNSFEFITHELKAVQDLLEAQNWFKIGNSPSISRFAQVQLPPQVKQVKPVPSPPQPVQMQLSPQAELLKQPVQLQLLPQAELLMTKLK